MSPFSHPIQLRWSDLDPNFHVRHSVYYDWGAAIRIEVLAEHGITPELMTREHLGPILFREEAVFRREIRWGHEYTIDLAVSKMRPDFSRFSFRHQIHRSDGVLCAVIHIDAAWMNTLERKLTTPPLFLTELVDLLPRTETFEWQP